MLNEVVVVVVSPFQGEQKADRNGVTNVWLTPVAGKIPNQALVVAGTVAESAGLVIGKTLLVMVNEGAEDPTYGRQFNHTVLGEVKPMEIIGLRKDLGAASIVVTKQPVNGEDTGAGAAAKPNLNTSGLDNATAGAGETPTAAGATAPEQQAAAPQVGG